MALSAFLKNTEPVARFRREVGERSVTGRGHCSAVEDGVLLGKREAGERSVTGWGPRIRLLSIATTKSQKREKKGGGYNCWFLFFPPSS
jgi:hypothetical protein